MEVQFSDNVDLAAKIADRASSDFVKCAGGRMSLMMDICAADGVNGNRHINLSALIEADDFNFYHDLSGIVRHMDRETGKLTGLFVPRFARAA